MKEEEIVKELKKRGFPEKEAIELGKKMYQVQQELYSKALEEGPKWLTENEKEPIAKELTEKFTPAMIEIITLEKDRPDKVRYIEEIGEGGKVWVKREMEVVKVKEAKKLGRFAIILPNKLSGAFRVNARRSIIPESEVPLEKEIAEISKGELHDINLAHQIIKNTEKHRREMKKNKDDKKKRRRRR